MSKKLEKNGLWESSRMMLPEHREALVQRKQPELEQSAKNGVPTQEELGLIRNYALLPIVLAIVENNYRKIKSSSYGLKRLYVKATEMLMDAIRTDLVNIKKTLRERNIKVYEDERIDGAIHYRFYCRGYEDNFAMMRDIVKAEASVKIGEYIAKILKA